MAEVKMKFWYLLGTQMVPTLLTDMKAKNDRSIKKMYRNWIQYMTTTCTTTSFNNVMIAYIAAKKDQI